MKISCLTITQLNRINLLRRCLLSYSEQTIISDDRELILIHTDGTKGSKAIEKLLAEYNVDARIFDVPNSPLGELRNISIKRANGELLCQWDDDDFYHPNRLLVQSTPFKESKYMATTLAIQFFWFCDKGDLYIRKAGKEGIHGSIMFRSDLGLRYDPLMSKGEDTSLIQGILMHGPESIHCIDDHPELYVRTYHGKNTWNFAHHYKHTRQALNAEWLLENEHKIRDWIKILRIPAVNIRDNNDQVIFSA